MNAETRCIVLAWALLLVVGVVPTVCQAEPSERRLPRLLIDSSPRKIAELKLGNGETLRGEPASADEDHFRWQTELFADAITLPHGAVRRMDFAGKSESNDEAFRFIFADGSHLTGALKSIDGQVLTLTSESCGDAEIRLDQVVAIERINGPGMVVAGPASLLTGDSTANGRFAQKPAYQSAFGEVVILEFNGGVRQAIDLPEKCLVELQLRIEGEPAFSLELASKKQWVKLETWIDELVLTNGESFASAGNFTLSDDGRIDLLLGWDQAAGTCILFDRSGKPRAELALKKVDRPKRRISLLGSLPLIGGKLEELMEETGVRQRTQPQKGHDRGITMSNHGAGFVVERYAVTKWAGQPPQGIPEAANGVEIAGEFISGDALACNGTSVTVDTDQGSREVPLEKIRSIRWWRPAIGGPNPPQTHLWYSNGNLVRGTLLGIAEGMARMQTTFSSDPLLASLEHGRALELPYTGADSGEGTERSLEEMDTIASGDLILHGTIKPSGGGLPGFVPAGGDTAMIPLAKEDLVYKKYLAADGEYWSAPALINTTGNQSLPVTVDQIDADKIVFHWEAADAKEVATAEIHSVQFPDPLMMLKPGFDAGGWKLLGRRNTPVESKDGGIVLQAEKGIGHPYVMHGEDFGFSFKRGSGNTSFRIRLFCQGTKRSPDSTNFLVAHYGNSVYAGLEQGQAGQFASNRSINVGRNDSVRVEFKFGADSVEILINKEAMGSSKLEKNLDGKTGQGLIIETTSVWGNSFGSVTLSDFSMRNASFGGGASPFSDDAKREALLLPRLRRDVPPRHILVGRNGDLLRGELGAKSDKAVLFRVGLEEFKIPIERISAAVWVEEADKMMADVNQKPAGAAGEADPKKSAAQKADPDKVLDTHSTQWLDLTNGGRLKLEVEAWSPESVIGNHQILGRCTIPTVLVHRVSLNEPSPNGALAALSNWKFEHTIDPNPPGQDEADVSPLVGKPAPDFTLKMLEGDDFKLSAAKGKVVVLDFWATWCAPCVRSLPHVITAIAEFPPEKVAFVAVNQGEARKQIEQFMEIRGFKMPVGFDLDMKTGEKFGVESIPFTVVIDPGGTVTYVSLGASPDGARKLAEAVTRALPAGEIE